MRTSGWTSVQLFYSISIAGYCGGLKSSMLDQDRTGSISVQELQRALMYHIVGYVVVSQQQMKGSARIGLTAHHESNFLSKSRLLRFRLGGARYFSCTQETQPHHFTFCWNWLPIPFCKNWQLRVSETFQKVWPEDLLQCLCSHIYCLHPYLSHMRSETRWKSLGIWKLSSQEE